MNNPTIAHTCRTRPCQLPQIYIVHSKEKELPRIPQLFQRHAQWNCTELIDYGFDIRSLNVKYLSTDTAPFGDRHVQVLFHFATEAAPIGDRRMYRHVHFTTNTAPIGDRHMYRHLLVHYRHGSHWGPLYVQVSFCFATNTAPIGERRMYRHFLFHHRDGAHWGPPPVQGFSLCRHRHGSHWGPYYVQVCCISPHTRLPSAPVFYFISQQTRLLLGTVACIGIVYVTTGTAPIGDCRMYRYVVACHHRHGSHWGPSYVQVSFCFTTNTAPIGDRHMYRHLYFTTETAPIGDRHLYRVFSLFRHRHGSHWGPYYVRVCCISTHTRLPSAPVFYFISQQTRLPLGTVLCAGMLHFDTHTASISTGILFYFTTDAAPIKDRRMYRHCIFHYRHGSHWGPYYVQVCCCMPPQASPIGDRH
jgi:hypothetical protein